MSGSEEEGLSVTTRTCLVHWTEVLDCRLCFEPVDCVNLEKFYNRLEKVPVDLIPMPLRGPDA